MTRAENNSTLELPLTTDLEAWRRDYVGKLAAPYGWWAITNLAWLEAGDNLLGSDPDARVRLPDRLPRRLANLEYDGTAMTVTPLAEGLLYDGAPLPCQLLVQGDQVLFFGENGGESAGGDAVRINLIKRGELCGVRVYDPLAAAARDPATEVAWFEPDPCWRIDAEFIPPAAGETVEVVNVLGQVTPTPVSGRARFVVEGAEHTLVATPSGANGRLFFNFKDATNRTATYGGGRFLNVDGPVDGRIVLDFNYAHHPPCAHTPYATCPTPSEENRLPVAVLAGERYAPSSAPAGLP